MASMNRGNISSANVCILNAGSFPVVCMADHPLSWPVSQFSAELNSPRSGLEPLRRSNVTDITVYHRTGGVTHDYLLSRWRITGLSGLTWIWARSERNPGSIPGGAAKLYREAAPALDTIKFSLERSKLCADTDIAIMGCAYDDHVTVDQLADLLHVIHEVSPKYGLASFNCWWYSAIVIMTMQTLGSDWTIKPTKDLVKKVVQSLGKSTRSSTEEINRRFAERWNSRMQTINSEQIWETGSIRSNPLASSSNVAINIRQTTNQSLRPEQLQPPLPNRSDTSSTWRDAYAGGNAAVELRNERSENQMISGAPGMNSSPHAIAPIPIPAPYHDAHAQSHRLPPPGGESSIEHILQSSQDVVSLHIEGDSPPPSYQLLADDFLEEPVQRPRSNTASTSGARPFPSPDYPIDQPLIDEGYGSLRSGVGNRLSVASEYGSEGSPMNRPPLSSSLGRTNSGSTSGSFRVLASGQAQPRGNFGGTIAEEDANHHDPPLSPISPEHSGNAQGTAINGLTRLNSHVSVRSTSVSIRSMSSSLSETETLDAIVWRVIWSRDPSDVQILLGTYPSFTSGSDLLHELKLCFRNTPVIHENAQWVRPKVVEILWTWTMGEYHDPSLGSEILGFIIRDVQTDPGFSMSREAQSVRSKLENNFDDLMPSSSISGPFQFGSPPTSTNSGKSPISRSSNSRKLTVDSLAKMKDKDIVELAWTLEVFELEMRSQQTIASVVRWLKWKSGPGATTHRLFSPLSDKIAVWVVDSCLDGNLERRASTLSKLVQLAQRCRENNNLASLSDLLYGLQSPAIERLHVTRKLSPGIDSKIIELVQLIHPRTPHRLYSLNPQILGLLGTFKSTSTDSGLISWSRCRSLFRDLSRIIAVSKDFPPPQIHLSFHSFLSVRIQSATQNALAHDQLSQKIALEEGKERVARDRAAAGMRAR